MITSIANQRIKRLLQLQEKSRLRNKEGVFVAEGLKMFEEAPMDGLEEVYIQESLGKVLAEYAASSKKDQKLADRQHDEQIIRKLKQCMERKIPVEQVADEIFKKAADTKSPQGILFIMKQLSYSLEMLVKNAVKKKETEGRLPLFLLLEDIQDPGNLGTMIRTAEGAGADAVIMSRGCVDIYNPKTIRSTMGSLYRVPFLYTEDLQAEITRLQQNGIKVYAAHLLGQKYFDEMDYREGSAFLIGNEGNGLKKETADRADIYVKIPMEGKLESLNAGIAAALLMYQAAGHSRRSTCPFRNGD